MSKSVYSQSHGAHVHGLAELTLVLEGNILEIEFVSPSVNVIGFEHKASSLKEKQRVKKVETILQSSNLFSFVGAHCQSVETSIDISTATEGEMDHHHRDHSQGHSEVVGSYKFSCVNTKKLNSVSIALFDQFPGIETINARWATDVRQGSKLLNSNKSTLSLR